jgi:predicted dehydrogenase
MDEVVIGLAGAGRWGALILRDLVGLGAVVHVADPDADARKAAIHQGADSACPGVGGWPPIDGVVVATPATTHADVIDTVSRLGVPVFCEKPLTTDAAAARRLADELGGRLHLLHTWRYHPGIALLGELARSGALGTVHGVRSYRTNWTSPRTDTDATWTLLPHDLSIAIEILGEIPPPAAATIEVIDTRVASIFATFGEISGPWLVVDASTRFADKRREVRVHGSEGVAVLAGLDVDHIEVARGHELEPLIERIEFDPTPPVRRQLEAVLDHLRGGPAPKSDAAEGAAVVEAIAAVRVLAGVGP